MKKFLQTSPKKLSMVSGDNIHIDIFLEMGKMINTLIKKIKNRASVTELS